MPVLDFDLDKLEKYKGINPCPKDINKYWKEAVEELSSFEWDSFYSPADFQAPGVECFDLVFTGVGGARIYAKYLRPKCIKENSPAIIQFHGYLCNSGDWTDKLKYVYAGFSVLAMDCRGQGGRSIDRVNNSGLTIVGDIVRGLNEGKDQLMYRSLFLDCVQLARITMELPGVDPDRVGVTGYSQGGALSLACASLEPRIKKVAAVYPFLSDYRRVWDMDLDKGAYGELRTFFRMYDPNHQREEEYFNTLGYIDIKNLTKRITGDVLMGITLLDSVCPPSTQFAVYNNINSLKNKIVYHDFGHEELPGMNDRIFSFLMGMSR
jgi:cephalosporin-C deacetylase